MIDLYANLFYRASLPVLRRQELQADALAARAVSAAATAQALAYLPAIQTAWRLVLSAYVVPARRRDAMLIDPFASVVRVLQARPELAAEALATSLRESTQPLDTHPSLNDRFAALGHNPDIAMAMNPVESLMADSAHIEPQLARAATRYVLRPDWRLEITLDEFPDAVFAADQRDITEDILKAVGACGPAHVPHPTPGTLDEVLRALETDAQRLSRFVQTDLRGVPLRLQPERQLASLRMRVGAAIGEALVTQGLARRAIDLAGDQVARYVDLRGKALPVAQWAADAVSGGAETVTTRRRLKRRGLNLDWRPPRLELSGAEAARLIARG